ncbi:hypothetical protein ACHQM5_015428 [Ranunculus cassubicifolius]
MHYQFQYPAGSPQEAREPCPDRILGDLGSAFAMGCVGSTIIYYGKGIVQGAKGKRLATGLEEVRMGRNRFGGSFAVWGGLFSTFDCTMVYLRQKEDPWNSITAGAATSAFLSTRQGAKAMMRSGVIGGVLLAMIEGGAILFSKHQDYMQQKMAMEGQGIPGMPGYDPRFQSQPAEVVPRPAEISESSGWGLGGLLGWGKKHEVVNKGGSEMLESFDTPSPPLHYEFK